MQVLLERIDGGYRATSPRPLDESAEGTTREEALARLQALLERRINSDAELVELPVAGEERITQNPWLRGFGMFKDDPFFDRWQEAIRENRRREDETEGIFPERNS